MTILSEESFDTAFPQSERDKYWLLAERVMKEVLNASTTQLEYLAAFKKRIADAPTFLGKALVYHDDFVEIARSMTESPPLNDDQILKCESIQQQVFA